MNLPRTSRKSLASTLRHRIVIEVRTDISDGEGGHTTEWDPVVGYEAVPAAVWPIVEDAIYLYCKWRYDNRAGEAGSVPKAFYNLLEPDRCFL